MRLIDADELKKCAIPCEIHNGALTDMCIPVYQIDNAPTVEITKEQAIDKLHETGWLPLHDKEMTERPQVEFELIKRAVLIFCRNVRPDGDMSYFDWEDRCKLQDIYHKLIKEAKMKMAVNLCDDCIHAEDCNPTLNPRDGVSTTQCSKYEQYKKGAEE